MSPRNFGTAIEILGYTLGTTYVPCLNAVLVSPWTWKNQRAKDMNEDDREAGRQRGLVSWWVAGRLSYLYLSLISIRHSLRMFVLTYKSSNPAHFQQHSVPVTLVARRAQKLEE